MALKTEYRESRSGTLAIVLATLALFISLSSSLYFLFRSPYTVATTVAGNGSSALAHIESAGVMRVGYGGFPPYTIVDPKESDPNKRVTGLVADMVSEIAKRHSPPLKVEWYNLNWDTFRADMLSGKFDFLADAVYDTVPKAAEFKLTDPFSYFGIAVAAVRSDDNRFQTFQDLDKPDITVALAQGYVSTDYAQQELTKAHLKIVPVGKDAFTQMDEVLLGRADAALNDVPTVLQYVRAHPTAMKALWIENPPSQVAASFVTPMDQPELLGFLNTSLRIIAVDGTMSRLDRKWSSLGFFPRLDLTPGSGLQKQK